MKVDFRNEARKSLDRARRELSSGDDGRLRYAALELRMCMEALTYDRAHAYKEFMPGDAYQAWQPRKVMEELLAIDPRADKGATVSVGTEHAYGVPPPVEEMVNFGTETILDASAIRAHYDALGSYLHVPTIKQLESGSHPDVKKLRAKCESVAAAVEAALASSIWNIVFGSIAERECAKCGVKIKRKISPRIDAAEVKCTNCSASYAVNTMDPQKVVWRSLGQTIECQTEGCRAEYFLWREDTKEGARWKCKSCGKTFVIGLAIRKEQQRF